MKDEQPDVEADILYQQSILESALLEVLTECLVLKRLVVVNKWVNPLVCVDDVESRNRNQK